MPKRKIEQDDSVGSSDISPPPEGLLESELALNATHGDTSKGVRSNKRRKIPPHEKNAAEKTHEETVAETSRTRRTRKAAVKYEEETGDEDTEDKSVIESKKVKKGSREKSIKEEKSEETQAVEKKPKAKRKTKEEKDAEMIPLAARTAGHKLFIGAHVSSAGGVQNSIGNSVHIGANAFALFLKSQRKWANPPLIEDACAGFHANCKTHTYDQSRHVVPHGSYLVNLAHTDADRTEQAYNSFLDDLQRCERLGIQLYNFHPGVANSTGGDRQAAIAHLASNINRAHEDTSTVVTLLENMAAGGNVLGSTFEDLRDIIALVRNKERVGVCFDTCHAFAGGYDLRAPEAFKGTMDQFQEVVGFRYLRALHMNDSKAPFASHRDLHANIGTGFLGLRAFHNIVNEPRFAGLPLILETPIDSLDGDGKQLKDEKGKDKEDKGIWAREIKLLESMVGMDVESEEFKRYEVELARKGEPERKRLAEQIAKKKEKDEKKVKTSAKGTGKGKGKMSKESESESES